MHDSSSTQGQSVNLIEENGVDKNGRIKPFYNIRIDNGNKCPISGIYLGPKNQNSMSDVKNLLWKANYIHATISKSAATYS